MEAKDLVQRLAARHHRDLFVANCPVGPNWGSGAFRLMDGWAMRRSWTEPTIYGYEVKVSRSDFMRDHKWREYLPFCNRFYFVCPPGIINREELPSDVGLMYATKTGGRLLTKVHAPHRTTEAKHVEQIMRAVLINRVKLVLEDEDTREQRIERWRERVESGRSLHAAINGRIAETLRRQERELEEARAAKAQADEFKRALRESGYDPDRGAWGFRSFLKTDAKQDCTRLLSEIVEAASRLRGIVAAARDGGPNA